MSKGKRGRGPVERTYQQTAAVGDWESSPLGSGTPVSGAIPTTGNGEALGQQLALFSMPVEMGARGAGRSRYVQPVGDAGPLLAGIETPIEDSGAAFLDGDNKTGAVDDGADLGEIPPADADAWVSHWTPEPDETGGRAEYDAEAVAAWESDPETLRALRDEVQE